MFEKTKKKLRTLFKRTVSAAAAAAMFMTAVLPTTAVEFSYDWSTSDTIAFTESFSAVNGGRGKIKKKDKMVAFKPKGEKYYAMCVLPGTHFSDDNDNDGDGIYVIPNLEKGDYWDGWYESGKGTWEKDLTKNEKKFVALCSYYGYPYAQKSLAYYYAAQALTWEIVMGYRSCDPNDSSSFADPYNGIKIGRAVTSDNKSLLSAYKKAYADLEKNVAMHYTRPSVLSGTPNEAEKKPYKMTYDWATGKYTASFNIGNRYMDSALPSNYRELIHDIQNTGFDVTYSKGSSSHKIVVSTNNHFSGKKTVSTVRRIEDVPDELKAKIYKKYDDQTLSYGTVKPDPYWGSISFEVSEMPNMRFYKTFEVNGAAVSDTELESYMKVAEFTVQTDYSGSDKPYYVIAEKSGNSYVFKQFTTDSGKATRFKLLEKISGKGQACFALKDLPSSSNGKTYKIKEVTAPEGFPKGSWNVTVSSYSDGSTVSKYGTNKKNGTGDFEFNKIIADENGSITDAADIDFSNAAFALGVVENGDVKYLSSSSVKKNGDGDYSAVLSGGKIAGLGTLSGGYEFELDKDGNFTIDNLPLNSSKCIPQLAVVELRGVEGCGYLTDYADNADSSISKSVLKNGGSGIITNDKTEKDEAAWANPYIVTEAGEGASVSAAMQNQYYHAYVSVHKVDMEDKPLAGAVFGLYDLKDNLLDTVETDSDGFGRFKKVLTIQNKQAFVEKYYVKEISAPVGYKIDGNKYDVVINNYSKMTGVTSKDFLFVATSLQTITSTVPNEEQTLDLGIVKQDYTADTGFVSGAVYGLYANQPITYNDKAYAADELIASVTTQNDMPVYVSGLPTGGVDENGFYINTYYWKEISAPAPFIVKDERLEEAVSSVSNTDTVKSVYSAGDHAQLLELKINKTGDENEPIEGAVFGVYADDEIIVNNTVINHAGDKICSITTDENGYAATTYIDDSGMADSLLHYLIFSGFKYYYVEEAAPDGYKLDSTKHYFSDPFDNGSAEVKEITEDVINNPITFEISKQDIYGSELEGAQMQIVNSDGIIVDEWTSGKENHVVKRVAAGDYTLKETAAPDGYIIATDISFSIDEYGIVTVNGVEAQANDESGNPLIVMVDDTTKVELFKTDSESNGLTGAELEVIDVNGNVVDSWTTDGEPHFIEAKLVSGLEYTLHEKSAPDGYVLSADVKFTVSSDGSVDKVTMTDDTTKLRVSKKSVTGADELSGATLQLFEVMPDGSKTLVEEWVSSDKPHEIVGKLKAGGNYVLHEEAAPNGYYLADDMDISMSDNGEWKIVTMSDDVTKKKIVKVDDSGNAVSGAKLQILDGEGNIVDEWTTDDSGEHITTGNLNAGVEYTLHEADVPDGYVMSADIKFSVSMYKPENIDDEAEKVTMTDDTTKLRVSKKSVTGADELLGATLQLFEVMPDGSKTLVEEWVSADEPHEIVGKLKAGGNYVLHEEVAPIGYTKADDMDISMPESGDWKIVTMTDDITKVKISKQDITTGKELPGATLQVIDKNGKVVDEWISTAEVHYIEGVLEAGGTYTLHEEIAPDGYKVANDITFTVSTDGSVDEVVMLDEYNTTDSSTPDSSTSDSSTPDSSSSSTSSEESSTPDSGPSWGPEDGNPSTGSFACIPIVLILAGACFVITIKKKEDRS